MQEREMFVGWIDEKWKPSSIRLIFVSSHTDQSNENF